ncbi:MAG: Mut7-C ubiquitin/RNAse domain-containing protein [Candidatus Brocadiaceae bacterium]|nr:Mut7-C ubiquitin/RNAse domain-containing protein [Candidatus Brocadiaceae bacterium]
MKKKIWSSYENVAQFHFYEKLNDFFPSEKREKNYSYQFRGNPSIKDPIEAIGVPHTEVDLIVVNGHSVSFEYRLQHGDQVAVYPEKVSTDIFPRVKLRDEPLKKHAFILDVHLGKLAKMLRMLGFDVVYENDYDDPEIIRRSLEEKRIIVTRDRRLLYVKVIVHGYCIRSMNSEEQLQEVLDRYDLYSQIRPFYRCMICNGKIRKIDKSLIIHRLEPKTKAYFNEFFLCEGCNRIYWKGSHHDRIQIRLEKVRRFHRDYKERVTRFM